MERAKLPNVEGGPARNVNGACGFPEVRFVVVDLVRT